MSHIKSEWAKDSEEEDRVESMIRSKGCWSNHVDVVTCMSEQRDWRKCQEDLFAFRDCMQKNQRQGQLPNELKEPVKEPVADKK